ncbi:hypothetical protein G5C51_04345 [Streptomyces sp. A7024]|uniref:Uncharacterized protein n=1 Tax=Streptomyces coryli TaxID=1128680 RepID=A0A6G4TVR7_9ACTN|nr:hypothetical protein [Streptomyces coryli]NGN63137.1 hypothetical protein [Streptomyces coryli]
MNEKYEYEMFRARTELLQRQEAAREQARQAAAAARGDEGRGGRRGFGFGFGARR